jgi:hypothetical protein
MFTNPYLTGKLARDRQRECWRTPSSSASRGSWMPC